MATIYDIKPGFQKLLRPLCRLLAKLGFTANQITVGALLLSFAGGAALFFYSNNPLVLFIIPPLLFIRMALNAIDGMLAREFNMKSSLGAILNEIGDVASDTALYLPFALIPGINSYLVITITILAMIVEMTGVVSVQIGASRRYDGPMGKSDRAFVFGILALLLAFGMVPGRWSDIFLGVVAILSLVTIINRSAKALKELKNA